MYASSLRKEKYCDHVESSQQDVPGLADSQAASSRPTDQQHRRPNSQALNVDVVARTAGGNWLVADVDDWQCLRQECSSPPKIEVLCSADAGERWCRVCTVLIVEHQASAARHAADETIIGHLVLND